VVPTTDGLPAAPLASVRLKRSEHGFELTIAEPANALTFPVGATDWLVSTPRDNYRNPIPVAASGGWLNEHTLRAEVILLETPHRMDITCDLQARIAEASWRPPPLVDGTMNTLHRPR
jgi:hypothetical protein